MADRATDYPIVDIHTHLFRTVEIGKQALYGLRPDRERPKYVGLPNEHLKTMKAAGVSYCGALAVTPTREMRERALAERGPYGKPRWAESSGLALDSKLLARMDHNNSWACALGQEHPELVPFIMVDPRLLSGFQLASYVQNRVQEGARGVKLLAIQTQHHGDDERLFAMYEYMQDAGIPLFAQSGAGGVPSPVTGDIWGRPMRFAKVLETFPRLDVVLAHALGGYNGSMGDTLYLADHFERVYFDTTVVQDRVYEAPDVLGPQMAELIRRVGPEHVVFGDNFPLFDYDRRRDIDVILGLPITDSEKRTILSDNGMRILHRSGDFAVGEA